MSDQPKPTGEQEFGEQIFCWKCGRPYHTADRECPNCGGQNLTPDLCAKPTGEWTAEYVEGFAHSGRIADAHNAALAAEREKVQAYEGALIKIANDPNCDRCQVAVNALSGVKEKVDDGGQRDEWFKALTTITKLEHQLAAARDALKHETWRHIWNEPAKSC